MKTKEERKRRMLLVLPVLLLPFLALGFYALGGGKRDGQMQNQQASRGINTSLPGAQLQHEQPQTKMSLYDKAKRDSASAKSSNNGNAFVALGWNTASTHKTLAANSAQANEAKINQKLAEINRQINKPEPVKPNANSYMAANTASPDLDRLEKLIKQKQTTNQPDPEMQQLNTMLDKIMQIQNPGLAKEKQPAQTVSKDSAFKAIPAIIDGNQKVAPGGVVKLRLQDVIWIKGVIIPKGQTVFGSCAIMNQRLLLDIRNIRLGTAIIPVNLTVFSLDGMPGIAAPEAELGEAAGSGANGALENLQFLSMDNSLSTQAATAGISAAKSLLGKKVKKIRVKLKGGQTVLLRINKS